MQEEYLDLLKKVLIDFHRLGSEEYKALENYPVDWKRKILTLLNQLLDKKGYAIVKKTKNDIDNRINGKDWPAYAETMIGLKRLENIQYCVEEILKNKIVGDFIETGVWRGGATIWMRALLRAYENQDKTVWVADSFSGLPVPDSEKYSADKEDKHYLYKELSVSIETVQDNFKKFDLWDHQVKFLKGWFKDTLPSAPIEKLSLMRLDGDMYESTMDALTNLYSKLSLGGFIIIDDWGAISACKEAVLDFRGRNNIVEEIIPIDWSGVYWKKIKQ